MMQIRRCKLGTVYTKSPAQLAYKWSFENTSKIVFAIIGCIIGMAVLYVGTGVVNFVGGHVAEMWDRETPTAAIYNHNYMIPVKVILLIFVFLYVFRDTKKT